MIGKKSNAAKLENPPYQLEPEQEMAVLQIMERYTREEQPLGSQWIAADRGWGKTYAGTDIARRLCLEYGIRPLIISPAGTVQETWIKMMDSVGVTPWGCVTWTSLAGRVGKVISGANTDHEVRAPSNLSHPWLIREDTKTGTVFSPTVEFENACKKGLFILADESQAVKNDNSARHWALSSLINYALAVPGGKVRVLHLTALFLDKEKSYECLYRVLGITNGAEEMFKMNHKTGVQEWINHGFGAVVSAANAIDARATELILTATFPVNNIQEGGRLDYKYRLNKKDMETALRLLWEQVFIHVYQAYTTDVVYKDKRGIPFKFTKCNGFFELTEDEAADCASAIESLKKAHVINNDFEVNAQNARNQISLVQSALLRLAHAKTPAFLRKIEEKLRADPSRKIIVIHPFLEDQNWLASHLKMYGVVMVNGGVKFDERTKNIALFNEPNLKCRVIIITPTAGGIGVSLHDHKVPSLEEFVGLKHIFKTPEECIFPRTLMAISNFDYMAMFQAYGRAYRAFMRSDVELIVFFASNAPVESILVNTMMKSRIAKNSITAKNREFPNDFDIFIENEGPQHAKLREVLVRMKSMSAEELKETKKTH